MEVVTPFPPSLSTLRPETIESNRRLDGAAGKHSLLKINYFLKLSALYFVSILHEERNIEPIVELSVHCRNLAESSNIQGGFMEV